MFISDDYPKAQIGQVAGIPVLFDITAIFVPLVFLSSISMTNLWGTLPTVLLVVFGVFFSVFLHELGHAAAARRYNLPVSEIVIGGFYGYARITRRAPSRGRAMMVLFAGPLANLFLFALLWMVLGMPRLGPWGFLGYPMAGITMIYDYPWLVRAVRWLAHINLIMFVLNLLPAFPLDGGRIYRLALMRWINTDQAARLIAVIGIAICALLAIRFGLGSIITLLILAQVAIQNIAVYQEPARAEVD